MLDTPPRILVCVHSLTAHGVVGLKPFLSLLGPACLPVPSILLSGPGNMPGVQRQPTEVARLLDAVLAQLGAERRTADLFIGYLANAAQVDALLPLLERHHAVIDHLSIDPVAGDDGRAYVSPEMIAAWPRLVARADLLLPNITEARLFAPDSSDDPLSALRRLAPRADIVITGIDSGGTVQTHFLACDSTEPSIHEQPRLGGPVSGTGDRFAAACWLAYRQHGCSLATSVSTAAKAVADCLRSG